MDFEQTIILTLVSAATICWVAYVLAGVIRRRDQLRAATEFQLKLLERVGSAREFGEVLNSEAGLKLMSALATERESRPQIRILRAIHVGMVMFAVGLALFVYLGESLTPIDVGPNAPLSVFATVAFSAGLALMLASGISYRLSRRMGLIADGEHANDGARVSQSGRASS
jgi:hypothetical protein